MGSGASTLEHIQSLPCEEVSKQAVESIQFSTNVAERLKVFIEEECSLDGAKLISICDKPTEKERLESGLKALNIDEKDCEHLMNAVNSVGTLVPAEKAERFETRGVNIKLLKAILALALEVNPDESFWTIGAISAFIVGNHEILREDCRWGKIDPECTLTYTGPETLGISLIDLLNVNYKVNAFITLRR